MRPPAAPVLLLAGVALALAPVRALAAWPHDPHQAIQVTSPAGTQRADAAVPDGGGGAIVVLEDDRGGTVDIYAQHLMADGTIDPAWGSGGVLVCGATGNQIDAKAVSNGAGGAYVCWLDQRATPAKVYGSEVLANGTIAAAFGASGLLLDTVGANADDAPQMSVDGVGGAAVVYEYETTAADHDVYGACFNGGGLAWSAALVVAPGVQSTPVVTHEQGAVDVAYVEAGVIKVGRWIQFNGASLTAPFAISNAAYVNSSPRIASSDDGGTIVTWAAQNGASWCVAGARFFGGIIYGFDTNLSPFASGQVYLGDEIDGGNYSAWLAWAQGGGPQTVYLQEITRNGASGPIQISGHGDPVSQLPVAAPDGLGGALAGFGESVGFEVANAMREQQNGVGAPALWNSISGEGVTASIGTVGRTTGAIAPDGAGGAIVFANELGWFPAHVTAMHIDRWGAYGGEPTGVTVQDVAHDQGGSVRVTWNASYLDTAPYGAVQQYWLWEQVPTAAARARIAGGAAVERAGASEPPAPGTLRIVGDGAPAIAWQYVGSQIADGFPVYSMTAATAGDSTASGNPLTTFMVEARDNGYAVGWPSAPATGYSVDNLAPGTPSPFAGTYTAGTVYMSWGAVLAADLAGYRLYRGTSAGFTPGPGNLLATVATTSTAYTDVAGAPYAYKLTAIDVHGNESAPALLIPSGIAGVADAAPAAVELALAGANPARAGMALRFALPAAGAVRLTIYDVLGRRVRTLAGARFEPGRYDVRWDGADESGARVADGLYLARLEADGKVLEKRIVTCE